jgi:DNA sulfur modification protein DndB
MYNNTKAAKLTCIKIKQLMSIELSESELLAEQALQKEVTQQ